MYSTPDMPEIDIIADSPQSGHIDVLSVRADVLTMSDVKPDGHLSRIDEYRTANHAHQVATNGKQVLLGDPANGALLILNDR